MVYYRTIRLSDTDAAGVVYFASLLSISHEAYEAALATIGVNLQDFFQDSAVAIPIVHGEIDCLRPVFCGDSLTIQPKPRQLSDDSFEVAYELRLATSTATLLAKGLTRHVCINPTTRNRISLPLSIRHWLEGD